MKKLFWPNRFDTWAHSCLRAKILCHSISLPPSTGYTPSHTPLSPHPPSPPCQTVFSQASPDKPVRGCPQQPQAWKVLCSFGQLCQRERIKMCWKLLTEGQPLTSPEDFETNNSVTVNTLFPLALLSYLGLLSMLSWRSRFQALTWSKQMVIKQTLYFAQINHRTKNILKHSCSGAAVNQTAQSMIWVLCTNSFPPCLVHIHKALFSLDIMRRRPNIGICYTTHTNTYLADKKWGHAHIANSHDPDLMLVCYAWCPRAWTNWSLQNVLFSLSHSLPEYRIFFLPSVGSTTTATCCEA